MNNPSAPDSFTAVDEEGNINHSEKNGEDKKHHLQFSIFIFVEFIFITHIYIIWFLET